MVIGFEFFAGLITWSDKIGEIDCEMLSALRFLKQ